MSQSSKLFIFSLGMTTLTIGVATLLSLPSTHATDPTSAEDTVRVVVDSSCGMSQTVLSSGTTMNPGEYGTIGSSRIAAYCNDSNGYDIYAIGYTNGEYGNTNMKSTTTTTTIPTGTSGDTSYWNMTLSPGTATSSPSYIPTIISPFTTPTTIPTDYTKVATYPSTTISPQQDPTTSGSFFTTTYEAHLSTTQPAGTYNGAVQYVMVHPHGAPGPTFMQNTTAIKTILTNEGDTMQAIDKRDGKKYWITMLADGNIWMTQNLDFDIDSNKTYTSADTDLPEGTTWTPSVSTYPDNNYEWNNYTMLPESFNPGEYYWNGIITSSGTLDNRTTSGDSHYHIGNYYNWTAAVAMNDSGSAISDVNQSICPAGWRLPSYGGDKSYNNLIDTQDLTAGVDGNISNAPTYFSYSGYWTGFWNSFSSFGSYWSSSTANTNYLAYDLKFAADGFLSAHTYSNKAGGYSIRCVAR